MGRGRNLAPRRPQWEGLGGFRADRVEGSGFKV